MEKLIYTHQRTSVSHKHTIAKIIISILTGISTVLCFSSCFGISFLSTGEARGGIMAGMAKFWNEISYTLLMNKGFALKEAAGAAEDCQLFLILMTAIVAVLTWLIMKAENPWLLLVFPAVICVLSFAWKLEPGMFLSGCLVACVIAGFLEVKMLQGINGWQIIYIVILLLAMLGLFSYEKTEKALEKANVIENVNDGIRQNLRHMYYGENLLNDGEVSGDKRVTEGEATALTVTMENPESTYLRGFVGELYSDGQWKSLPHAAWQETKNLFYWLNQNGFVAEGQLGQANSLVNEQMSVNSYHISVKQADKEYAYVPYEFISTEDELHSWYGGYFTDAAFGKLKEYSYQAGENATSQWTDITGKFFTTETTEEMTDYLIDESHYNQFVYSYYTYLSAADKEILKEYIGDAGDQSKGHIEYKAAINKIQTYLDEKMLYTDNPALADSEAETVLEAMLEQGKGYDVHYATAATLLFRYYGIPARYVEGYLITPEDAEGVQKGETVEIPMSNIHAWTEIYIDGIGFVPIEVSPEYAGLMREADMSVGIDNDVVQKNFESTDRQQKTLDTLESGSEEQTLDDKIVVVFFSIFLILIILLICCMIYRILKKVYRSQKQRRLFKSNDRKLAVCAMYKYMEDQKLNVHQQARALGNKAAYSTRLITEGERQQMFAYIKEMKMEKRKNEKKN